MGSGSIQISVPGPEIHFQTSTMLVVVPTNGTLSHPGPGVMLMVW